MRTAARTTPNDTRLPAHTKAKKKKRVPAPEVDWTVMVFMVGDNNLEKKCKADLAEIEKAGSSKDVTVIVQTDLGPSGGSTKRYVIKPRSNNSLDDDVDEQWPETRPEVLKDFLHWCITYHPAKRYMLLLWGHGRALDSFEVKSNVRQINLRVSRAGRGRNRTTSMRSRSSLFVRTMKRDTQFRIRNYGTFSLLRVTGSREARFTFWVWLLA